MSLWPVDDAATQLLMQQFYTNWIGKKHDKRTAFSMAQLVLRQQYSDPKYWAGFILLD
jgi:CHAT domain-containing protein